MRIPTTSIHALDPFRQINSRNPRIRFAWIAVIVNQSDRQKRVCQAHEMVDLRSLENNVEQRRLAFARVATRTPVPVVDHFESGGRFLSRP